MPDSDGRNRFLRRAESRAAAHGARSVLEDRRQRPGRFLMPAVSPNKLAQRLAQGKPAAAIVLLGTDSYLREMCRAKIIEAFVPEAARDWAVARVSPREISWDEILQRAETMPMLAPRQVIVIEDAESVEKLGDKSR